MAPRTRSIDASAVCAAVLALVLAAAPAAAVQVALAGAAVPEAEETDAASGDPVVRRIQKGLTAAGFYAGPQNGRLNRETRAAIRAYQRSVGVRVDGRSSEKLAVKIETTANVEGLLGRLERVREEHIAAARRALLSNPATRELLSGGGDEVADPTRDPAPCFRRPTAACLLAEASESAKAIHRADMRDWALGEILAAQARAGLTQDAMATVRRIGDARLIMVALRDIAEALARAGQAADALAAVAIIPDTLKQAEALAAIAAIQNRSGDDAGARRTARRLVTTLKNLAQPPRQVAFYARVAVTLTRAGDAEGGQANLAAAQALVRDGVMPVDRDGALRHVAAALAEMGRPDRALAVLDEVGEDSDRLPVLVAAATAEAEAGAAARALAIAEIIGSERCRAVVLSRIALAQARAGEKTAARATAERAVAAAEQIERPYARDFGLSRAALALAELGRLDDGRQGVFERAVAVAGRIRDNTLRAHTLWTTAAERRRAGDAAGADETGRAADAATDDIVSSLSRVWMFGDIAAAHIAAGETAAARAAFDRGLAVAETVHNAWARARALGRLAVTFNDLIRAAPRPGRR